MQAVWPFGGMHRSLECALRSPFLACMYSLRSTLGSPSTCSVEHIIHMEGLLCKAPSWCRSWQDRSWRHCCTYSRRTDRAVEIKHIFRTYHGHWDSRPSIRLGVFLFHIRIPRLKVMSVSFPSERSELLQTWGPMDKITVIRVNEYSVMKLKTHFGWNISFRRAHSGCWRTKP